MIGPDGRSLSQFLTSGLTDEERERIGPLPAGHGLLGELIRNPEPLRLSELGAHEASFGFPEHHPPMRTFLGVPIRVRDEVFGNLYLTDKRDGLDFDAEDESVITTLAVAAGVAIDNARLYESSQRQHRWLRAGAEVTDHLLSGDARQDVLELVARRAGEITGARLAEVSTPVPGTDNLVVELSVAAAGKSPGDGGGGTDGLRGLVVPADGTRAGAASAADTHVVSACLGKDPRLRTDSHLPAGPRRRRTAGGARRCRPPAGPRGR